MYCTTCWINTKKTTSKECDEEILEFDSVTDKKSIKQQSGGKTETIGTVKSSSCTALISSIDWLNNHGYHLSWAVFKNIPSNL